jgi:hypothetical protein
LSSEEDDFDVQREASNTEMGFESGVRGVIKSKYIEEAVSPTMIQAPPQKEEVKVTDSIQSNFVSALK